MAAGSVSVGIPVFVPRQGHLTLIEHGSGIVGRWREEAGDYHLWYEGGRHAENIRTFADRCYHAADRMVSGYPTVARCLAWPGQIVMVGHFDNLRGEIILRPEVEHLLQEWIGEYEASELLATDLAHVRAQHT